MKPTPATRVLPGTATSTPSASTTTRPLRSALGNPNARWAARVGASTRVMRSSRFWREAAWRERVPARKRSTKRSRRAISAAWSAASAPWRSMARARSRRKAE